MYSSNKHNASRYLYQKPFILSSTWVTGELNLFEMTSKMTYFCTQMICDVITKMTILTDDLLFVIKCLLLK